LTGLFFDAATPRHPNEWLVADDAHDPTRARPAAIVRSDANDRGFPARGIKLREIRDGTLSTACLVPINAPAGMPWTEPKDVPAEAATRAADGGIQIVSAAGQDKAGYFSVGFCDGSSTSPGFTAQASGVATSSTRWPSQSPSAPPKVCRPLSALIPAARTTRRRVSWAHAFCGSTHPAESFLTLFTSVLTG